MAEDLADLKVQLELVSPAPDDLMIVRVKGEGVKLIQEIVEVLAGADLPCRVLVFSPDTEVSFASALGGPPSWVADSPGPLL